MILLSSSGSSSHLIRKYIPVNINAAKIGNMTASKGERPSGPKLLSRESLSFSPDFDFVFDGRAADDGRVRLA